MNQARMFLRDVRVGITAAATLAAVGLSGVGVAQTKKGFINYVKPTPITCSPLSAASWGVAGVLPRDLCNGIESHKGAAVPPDFYYWDGKIIRAKDGKFHMFMSTWSGSAGFNPGWTGSDAFHAISTQGVLGPYERRDYVYSNNGSHKGHNVSALELPDGTYAVVVSETVPFTIYQSSSLDGPWKGCQASIQANGINYGSDGNFASNVSLVVRHDGKYQIVQRHGLIGTADAICGPYKLQKPTWAYPSANRPTIDSIYPRRTSIPGVSNPTYAWEEDPHIWRSGGVYHVLYAGSGDRVGWHLYSPDGINNWTDDGLAFSPREYQKIFCYEGSTTCTQWYKMERPSVVLQDGHPTHITWAVADVDKDNQIPANSNHGSKVIVVPFDGVAFDTDYGSAGSGGSGAGGMGGAAAGGSSTGGVSSSSGGTSAVVSSIASGGKSATGGATAAGGVPAGGAKSTGGSVAAMGGTAAPTGGSRAAGGAATSGGANTTGGSKATGGTTAVAAAGGAVSTAGAPSATGGSLALGGAFTNTGGRSLAGIGGSVVGGGAGVSGSAWLADDMSPASDSGCGCRTAGSRRGSTGSGLWGALGAMLVCAVRRRARQAASTSHSIGGRQPPRTTAGSRICAA